ncbi:sugar lactone lactonase YvrE [Burkholderia sp. OAS925]|uniref:SMP-30/gluconolactonase/LRE family protein n=1 Tax=Paraburkholderia TaxID=1822464 RepID=UPI001788F966|nr:SMP-30/gluconolactonase/LRE family protein [Paraburkholderia graminis]MDR6478859.1 sugar lactone lactonase YvrE [Paraburkholderia graminis]
MPNYHPTLWVDDFAFLEAPRWHQNRLWVSDVFDKKLYTVQPDGTRTHLCDVPHRPAGIGFLPDGTPIVVSMQDRKLLKLVDGAPMVHGDLSGIAVGDLNDLVVDERGWVYTGNFGYDHHGGAPSKPTDMHVVDPNGAIHVAASGLEFPNGMVIINDGRTLVVAETWVSRLTAFDRSPDGTLSNARLYADLGNRQPDGICADAENAIWAASFNTGEFVRVLDGGEVTDRITCGPHAIACVLGGTDGKTLFCSAYTGSIDDMGAGKRLGALFQVQVDVPGIGFSRGR